MPRYLSYLMGGSKITDEDLLRLHIDIGAASSENRMLSIPRKSIEEYKKLIEEKLDAGFWNDILGEKEIIFIFKFKNGTTREFVLSKENQTEIAELCSEFNGDPMKKTSDILHYLAGNSFYKNFINRQYLGGKRGL